MTKTKNGQTLVSFCLCLPVMLAAVGAFVWGVLALSARAWLDLEIYALARAHLHGNALDSCHGRGIWKLTQDAQGPLRVEYECPVDGTAVTGKILWNGQTVAESTWDLSQGRFTRN